MNVSVQMNSQGRLPTFVVREISRIRAGPKSDWRYDLAQRFDVLPIAADASGALFVRADGAILTMGWTKGEVPRVAHDPQAFLPVLERFVRDNPEANELLRLHTKEPPKIIVVGKDDI